MRWELRLAKGARSVKACLLAAAAATVGIALAPAPARADNPHYVPLSGYSTGHHVDGSYQGSLSDDGKSAVYLVDRRRFVPKTNGNSAGIFYDHDGQVTDLITKPPPNPEIDDEGGSIIALSADGSTVVVATMVRLRPSDTDDRCDLYEYRGAHFEAVPGGCAGFLGISSDGRELYLSTDERLTPPTQTSSPTSMNGSTVGYIL